MANKYWRERIEAEQRARIEADRSLSDEMDRLYSYHFKALETEIRAFEQRYADKNNLPISEVKKRVDDLDVKAFEEKAKRYVAEKDFSAKANAELSLYNLKMKVSRLELLQYQLDLEMLALSEAEHKLTERFLNNEYTETLKSQAGLLGQSVVSSGQIGTTVQAILNTSFNGAKWSDRIWDRQSALRQIVAGMTEDYLLKGKNPTTFIGKLRKEFDVSASQAKRLAVTEGARVATEAQKQSLLANGYDEYEYIAEPKACEICKALDGKIFKVSKMVPGENAAPMHPWCRCSIAAHFSEDEDYEQLIEKSRNSTAEILAEEKLKTVKEIEPKITSDLKQISKANGSYLDGLGYKFKTKDSLIRKIKTDSDDEGISFDKSVIKINDALRYTAILEAETFGVQFSDIKKDLLSKNYGIIKVKNTWLDDSVYNGVNVIIQRNDDRFELQFHTKESFELKNGELHTLYEEYRSPETPLAKKAELNQKMRELSQSLKVPTGIESVS